MGAVRLGWAGGLAGTLVVLAGCGLFGDGKDDMRQMSEAQAAAEVQRYADQVAAAMGSPLINPGTHSAPCDSDGVLNRADESVRYMSGFYNVMLPAAQHLPTLARLRDQWRAQGWKIIEDQVQPNNLTGSLAATTVPDDFAISLTGTGEHNGQPTAFMLMIGSPCYRSTDPV